VGEGWRPGRRGPIMVAMAEQEQPSPVPPGTTGTEPPAAAAAPAPSPSGLRTPAGRRPPTLAGLVAWSVALGLVLLIAVSQNLDGQGAGALSADERDAAGAGGMLEVASKYAVAVKEQGGSGATGLVIEKIRPMVGRPAEELRLAILEAELAGEGGPALKRLAEIDQPGPQTADDVRVLRELYHDGPGAVDEAERQRLLERHGWFGRLALSFESPAQSPSRVEVIGEATRVLRVVVAGTLVGAGMMLVGLALFVTAAVLVATGSLRPRFIRPRPGPTIGIETFAVFLVAFLALQLVLGLLEAAAPGSERYTASLVWVLLLVPLWPLVRGVSLADLRTYLGWRADRGVLREMGAGALGYLAGLPVVATGIALTLLLLLIRDWVTGDPDQPAPTHPLPDRLASGDPLTLLQIGLLAVAWAPIVEETIFRGALYSQLRSRLGVLGSGLISALFFAAVHPQGWAAIPALGAIGLNFALLREWRGSLVASMTAHAINNGLLVLLLLLVMAG